MLFLRKRNTLWCLVQLFLLLLVFTRAAHEQRNTPLGGYFKGLTMVGTPRPFQGDPFAEVRQLGANWIALVPFAFMREGEPEVFYGSSPYQWWGERLEGLKRNIELAHKNGLKVMLKPQIYIHQGWVGDLHFETEADWQIWERTYEDYLFQLLELARAEGVEMFCLGTEFKACTRAREKFWRKLIADFRRLYSGKLVYSANWDYFEQVPFWDALDYIGISAYFPLSERGTPRKSELLEAWKPLISRMKALSETHGRKVVFTEFGYLSVDGCAGKTWELEKSIHSLQVNQAAQAIAIDALYSALWHRSFWAGGFLWKWFPEMMGHEGYPEKDYTPQDKQGEEVLRHWFGGQ